MNSLTHEKMCCIVSYQNIQQKNYPIQLFATSLSIDQPHLNISKFAY